MQLQNTPCTAQVAGHTSEKSWPAKLRAPSATILAAVLSHFVSFNYAKQHPAVSGSCEIALEE